MLHMGRQALKLQQKMVPRALADLQKNVTAAVASIAAEMSSFHQRIADLEAASDAPATCTAAEADALANDSGLGGSSHLASQQDFGDSAGDVQPVLDMQTIAQELAALRTAAERANRREFAMVSLRLLHPHSSETSLLFRSPLQAGCNMTQETAKSQMQSIPVLSVLGTCILHSISSNSSKHCSGCR